jgi:hypothetical protein
MLLRAIRRTLRIVGVEWDTAACKTAKAAGHTRVRADVARFDLTAFAGLVWLLIMSPPCQAWSRSGKRRGILDQEAIFRHAMRVTAAGEWIDYTDAGPLPLGQGDEGGTWHDARSPLVLEVLRWVLAVAAREHLPGAGPRRPPVLGAHRPLAPRPGLQRVGRVPVVGAVRGAADPGAGHPHRLPRAGRVGAARDAHRVRLPARGRREVARHRRRPVRRRP